MLFIFLSVILSGTLLTFFMRPARKDVVAMGFFLHTPSGCDYYVLSENHEVIHHDSEPANFNDVFPEHPSLSTSNLVLDRPEYSLNVELATDTLLDILDLPVHQAFTIRERPLNCETKGKTVRELKAMAKNRGIKGYSKMNKLQLSGAIEAHENRT